MENVLRGSNKVIVETGVNGQGQGVIPYLPLPELDARRAQPATQGGSN
jgi:modulator of FtsH protease HflK